LTPLGFSSPRRQASKNEKKTKTDKSPEIRRKRGDKPEDTEGRVLRCRSPLPRAGSQRRATPVLDARKLMQPVTAGNARGAHQGARYVVAVPLGAFGLGWLRRSNNVKFRTVIREDGATERWGAGFRFGNNRAVIRPSGGPSIRGCWQSGARLRDDGESVSA
jgi:hypothetical protein